MLTKQQPERDLIEDKSDQQRITSLIEKWILDLLGEPANLHDVQVRLLWPDHYRVNVLVGPDAASIRIAHSFFLEANRDGDIVAATPSISRQY
jgi:hypothetical protein